MEVKRIRSLSDWRDVEGDPTCATEGDNVVLAIRSSSKPEVLLGGEDVPAVRASRRGGWWKVGIRVGVWAGRLQVLIRAGRVVTEWLIDVRPEDSRFPNGRVALEALLEVLLAEHGHLPWGMGPTFLDAVGGDGSAMGPPVLHPAVLAIEGPRLKQALAEICRQPLKHLVRGRALIPYEQCQGADATTVRRLLARPVWTSAHIDEAALTSTRLYVDQPVVTLDVGHPATRSLKKMLERLCLMLKHEAAVYSVYLEHLRRFRRWDEHRVAERLRNTVVEYGDDLRRTLLDPFWRAICPEDAGPAAAMAFRNHPVYSRAYRSLRHLLRLDVRQQINGVIRATLRPAFDLFEIFVWLRVRRAVADALGDSWQWTLPGTDRVDVFQGPIRGACAVARRGHFSVAIRYQQEFVSAIAHNATATDWEEGRYSLSGRRVPDVVVEVSCGASLFWWAVIDAKFCAKRYLIESEHLPAMHVYRDALRWRGLSPDVGYIVTPSLSEDAGLFCTDDYRSRFRFGVMVDDVLAGACSVYRPLTDWLMAILSR